MFFVNHFTRTDICYSSLLMGKGHLEGG